ncbi:hypothetical protein [Flavonifractor sp. HCP28S3_F3]|uniref:hypothetical protein n=1 Tax=Flavonifractor sp. HCP28S3_F3 TaxID=3438939 RepID=UPI003F89F70F
MIGVMELTAEKGRKPVLVREGLLGLRCLRVQVPIPERMGERRARRRIEKGARALGQAGVRRVLTASDFPYWEELRQNGLRPVEVEPFCQALAEPLTLAALRRRRVPPTQAVVALSGPSVSRWLLQAARQLCPQVRCLAVDVAAGGAELSDWLWREFGAAVVDPGAGRRADVALRFGPGGMEGDTIFSLWGQSPDLAGFRPLPPDGAAEGELDVLPLLSLLWEEGRLDLRKIRISST